MLKYSEKAFIVFNTFNFINYRLDKNNVFVINASENRKII